MKLCKADLQARTAESGLGVRMKQIPSHRYPRKKCAFTSIAGRRFMCISLLAFLLLGYLFSEKLLYSSFQWGPSILSEASLVRISRNNPSVDIEREKIKSILEETQFGRIGIRDALYPKKAGIRAARIRAAASIRRRELRGRAWMLPLASRVFDPHVATFIQLSKTWLGTDFEPADIMHDLLKTVKVPLDQSVAYWTQEGRSNVSFAKNRTRYQSCAVVGNSGILLNATHGEQIDSHEVVIRLNNAEIDPYQKHVGSKTTLSFLNSNVFKLCATTSNCWCHPYGDDVPIIMYICQAYHLMHAAMCSSQQKAPLLLTNSLLDALCAAIVKWYSLTNFVRTTGRRLEDWESVHHEEYFHYSSGMQAIVLALGICDNVDIYGFGKFVNAKHHYHTEQKAEQKLHDYAAEYTFYDDLVHKRKVPFLTDVRITLPTVKIFY